METIRTRCPSCHKLYSVDPHLIKSSQPQFECLSCRTRFYFEFPFGPQPNFQTPLSQEVISQIATFGMDEEFIEDAPSAESAPEPRAAQASEPRTLQAPDKQCPKCGALNRAAAEECSSCGIVFRKYRSWKKEEQFQNLNKQVSQAWRAVLNDYDNKERHARFLEVCLKAQELPAAARNYQTILSVQPDDEIASEMSRRLVELAEAPLVSRKLVRLPSWRTALFSFVILVGALLTVTGFTVDWARNLIGVGVSLIITAISARVYLRYLV